MQTETEQAVKKLFEGRETRNGSGYSPYVAGADEELEALLLRAFLIAEDPQNESPLSTPPSSPTTSCQTLEEAQQVTQDSPQTPPPLPTPPLPAPQAFNPTISGSKPTSVPANTRQSRPPKSRIKTPAQIAREKIKSKRARRKARRSEPSIIYSRDPEFLVQASLRSAILNAAQVVSQTFQVEEFHPAGSGYLGLEKGLPDKRDYSLQELTDPDGAFRFSKLTHSPSSSQPLTTTRGAVMGVVIPGPQNDPSWAENVQAANAMIERLGAVAKFQPPRLTKTQLRMIQEGLGGPTVSHPRRGNHKSLSFGPSTGNGQKVPQMMRQDPKNQPIMDEVRRSRVFQRWISRLGAAPFHVLRPNDRSLARET
ncbi:hypothetical protein VNI00_019288 [Paramarasmius palmivorus]|uniref:Uncharacterized protein n=1 Tax=Paramarasmius palmivorus TaxID=297713 RepID=A0AAW0AN92_9AGAR